ncbi:hypothetical protein R078131_00318 [Convivina intestini]|nr:hypothetical protein R078131_00318 [Convivina intestini]
MAEILLTAMNQHDLELVICRAPEFYGPNHTQSITNTLVFDNFKNGRQVKVPISDTTLRTLIWTPDASRAMALIGNTADAYNQTWHLPCDSSVTYQTLIHKIEIITKQSVNYQVIPMWQFKLAAIFNKTARELGELLPRYQVDNLFSSDKFKQRFPDFTVTSLDEGIRTIINE